VKGNNNVDAAAEMASNSSKAVQAVLIMPKAARIGEDVVHVQERVGEYEQDVWLKRGVVYRVMENP